MAGIGLAALVFHMTSAGDGRGESGPTGLSAPKGPELDYSTFDPSFIISDAEFDDANSMSLDEVAAFIDTWNAGCVKGRGGTPCLGDYTEDTQTREPDAYCQGRFEGAAGDSAASIIVKTSRACGVNPKVLLTTLQKEQGLITASGFNLTPARYASAMGYACPDGQACDGAYAGFSRQVFFAARQFEIYEADPARFRFHAGETVDIPFNHNEDCGAAPVSIANRATATLYNYTPYQPNPEALAGNGGNECSTWGNLNFQALYTAWFGPSA